MRSRILVVALLILEMGATPLAPPRPPSTSTEAQIDARLLATARIWGDIKYFDPYIIYRGIDWDGALMRVVPAVESSHDESTYPAAVSALLANLRDPLTHVIAPTVGPTASNSGFFLNVAPVPRAPNTIVLSFDWTKTSTANLGAIVQGLSSATVVVVDLRFAQPETDRQARIIDYLLEKTSLGKALIGKGIPLPSMRHRSYDGFLSQDASQANGGAYDATFVEKDTTSIAGNAPPTLRLGFLVGPNTIAPSVALAMIQSGTATMFGVDGGPIIASRYVDTISLTDGVSAQLRVGEYARIASNANVSQVLSNSGNPVATAAHWLADHSSTAVRPSPPPVTEHTYDNPYSTPAYPDEPHRVLAIARIYNVIRYFWPYYSLMGGDWDIATEHAFADVRAATNATSYLRAIQRYYANLHDSHGFIEGQLPGMLFGGSVPWATRWLHGQAIVTALSDDVASVPPNLRIGDVVVAINGVPIAQAIASQLQYVDGSTEQAVYRDVIGDNPASVFNGAPGSPVRVTLRHPGSPHAYSVTVARTLKQSGVTRTGPVVAILPGNVGYIDLDRLEVAGVGAAFRYLAGTRAIVFDGRGYPKATAWSIAPRLATRGHIAVARFDRPSVVGPLDTLNTQYTPRQITTFYDYVPQANVPKYLKPTVMLVDERTQSQAEYTAMMFEAAGHTALVGSATAGADGDATFFTVPGGITLMFSGESVRRPNGQNTQRVGLHIAVPVAPSASDIAAGNDPVLQAGIATVLRETHATPVSIRSITRQEQIREHTAFTSRQKARSTLVAATKAEDAFLGRSLPGATATTALPTSGTIYGQGYTAADSRTGGWDGGAQIGVIGANATDLPGYETFDIPLAPYRGKTIHVFGMLATRNAHYACFWLNTAGTTPVSACMRNRQLPGIKSWEPFSIVLPVPKKATRITGGLELGGKGAVYASNLKIEIVPATTPAAATLLP